MKIPMFRLLILSALAAGHIHAAELRTFALSEILQSKDKDGKVTPRLLPAESGVIYHLPRTRIHVELPLAMQREVITTTTRKKNNANTTQVDAATYRYVVDSSQEASISIVMEDDPDLAFFVLSEGGFLTDISGGAINLFENTQRISSIGVTYEDKKAEAITGTIKFLGDLAGTIVGAIVKASDDDWEEKRVRREKVEGVSAKFIGDIIVNKHAKGANKTTIGIDLTATETRLYNQLKDKLESEGLHVPAAPKTLSVSLEISSESPLHPIKTSDFMKSAPEAVTVKKVSTPYYPGIVYRNAGPAVLTLFVGGKQVAEGRHRLPEAGAPNWFEISSKLFAKVTPGITFAADGSLKEFKFAVTTKITEALAAAGQANTSANALITQIQKAEADKKAADAALATSNATLELKKENLRFLVEEKKIEIATLDAKIQTAKEDEKPELESKRRKAASDLVILEKRQAFLEKGIDITL